MNSLKGVLLYDFTIPLYDSSLSNIFFMVSVGNITIRLDMMYKDSTWISYVTFPDGKIRYFSVLSYVMQWGTFKDYSLAILSDDIVIDNTNLTGQLIRFYKWKV